MLQGKKVLVTGASGFIGSHVARYLLRQGAIVRGMEQRRDLTDNNACKELCEGMDYVFMCAASTAGAAVIVNNPTAHITPNIVMNAQILDAAHKAGVKKVAFISSSTGYPEASYPMEEKYFFMGEPPDVYYAVGWMKRYTEILCKTYAMKLKNPMQVCVVRPSNVYGPNDKFDPANSHVTPALIRKVVERHAPIMVWGDGEDRRDLIYIDDFIEGLFKVFTTERQYCAVNIASGQTHSVKDILNTILKVDGYEDAEVIYDSSKPQTIRSREIDVSLAEDVYGFKATTSLEDGILKTIEWFKGAGGILSRR